MSNIGQTLGEVRTVCAEANRLFQDTVREHRELLTAYVDALKRGEEVSAPDPFIERFAGTYHFSHWGAHTVNLAYEHLHSLDKGVTAENLATYYEIICNQAMRIREKYLPSVRALAQEIAEYPERVKPGEEALKARIQANLVAAEINAVQVADAIDQHQQALGINPAAGRTRSQ